MSNLRLDIDETVVEVIVKDLEKKFPSSINSTEMYSKEDITRMQGHLQVIEYLKHKYNRK
jgi:hypothetical protein